KTSRRPSPARAPPGKASASRHRPASKAERKEEHMPISRKARLAATVSPAPGPRPDAGLHAPEPRPEGRAPRTCPAGAPRTRPGSQGERKEKPMPITRKARPPAPGSPAPGPPPDAGLPAAETMQEGRAHRQLLAAAAQAQPGLAQLVPAQPVDGRDPHDHAAV